MNVPEGYEPFFRASPFLEATGPYYYKQLDSGFIIALRADEMHTNLGGTVHGGLLATLADISMGSVAAMSQSPPLRMLTVSLNIDFLGAGKRGDWIESHVTLSKVGSRLAFANAAILANGNMIARTSAVFAVGGPQRGG